MLRAPWGDGQRPRARSCLPLVQPVPGVAGVDYERVRHVRGGGGHGEEALRIAEAGGAEGSA